jgi:DNA-directed RNA polymerase I, II, and III subunit RPABC2
MMKKKIVDISDKESENNDEIEDIDDINEEEDEDVDYDNYEVEEEDEEDIENVQTIINEENNFNEDYENSVIESDTIKYVENKQRISSNRLTKYEMVRILGERTKQLTMGAKPLIKNAETLNYERIAEEELKLNMIPFKIKRYLPNGTYEIWTLDELYKDHLLSQLEF